jgi:hypothetical protein
MLSRNIQWPVLRSRLSFWRSPRVVILAQPESPYLLLPLPVLFRPTPILRHPDRSAQRAVEGPRISLLLLPVLFRPTPILRHPDRSAQRAVEGPPHFALAVACPLPPHPNTPSSRPKRAARSGGTPRISPLPLPVLFHPTQTLRHPDRSAQRAVEGPPHFALAVACSLSHPQIALSF